MGQADVLQRQLGQVENLVAVHAAERDFSRRDQAKVGVRQAVDLGLRPTRDEADPFQHIDARHVRRDDRRIAFAQQHAESVLDEG